MLSHSFRLAPPIAAPVGPAAGHQPRSSQPAPLDNLSQLGPVDKSSAAPPAAAEETTLHPTILDRAGSSIPPSLQDAPAADKDERQPAVAGIEAQAPPAPVEDGDAKPKRKKSKKGKKTEPQDPIAAQEDTTPQKDRVVEALVTSSVAPQERNETEIAETEVIESVAPQNLVEEPESYIADAPAELPPIPEDEPLTDLPSVPPIPADTVGGDTSLSRSGSRRKNSKSRRSSLISLAAELEQAGEEVTDTADNTRANSPTPSEDSFVFGDDGAISGGEQQPGVKRSGSKKKKKKSGSQRRKERALKRTSLTNLQQASQDAAAAAEDQSTSAPTGAEKGPESIDLPAQEFKSPDQSDYTGGVKLDATTPFFEKGEEKEQLRS